MYHLKSLSSTDSFGSKLSVKSSNMFRLYFEHCNGLDTANAAWKSSCKYRILRKLWIIFDVNLIGLVEIQINTELLSRGKDVKENLFKSDVNNTIFTSNRNELIDFRQKGGFLSSVRGKLARFT